MPGSEKLVIGWKLVWIWYKVRLSYLLLAKLSATRSSNISKSKWVAKLISIALYWMYSSAFNRFWGLRHQTKDPTMAPATETLKLEKNKYFSKIWYYTVWKIQDFSISKILCEINFKWSRSMKNVVFWNFGFWKMKKYLKFKIQRLQMCHFPIFGFSDSQKIDFTENLSDRKWCDFHSAYFFYTEFQFLCLEKWLSNTIFEMW